MTQTATKIKLKPVGNRIIVKRLKQEDVQGGIILPDSAKTKQESAEVLAVGTHKDMPDIKAGDKILMDKYAGQEVTVDLEEYTIVRADDVVAIIED